MTEAKRAALPRGLRNFNPGNIRHGQPWQGRAAEQPDPAFVTFESYAWGIRAMAKTLITYQDTYGLNTVRGIIGRWAPPTENDTAAYVAAVAAQVGVAADQPIDVQDYAVLRPLVEAIARHENGQVAPITPADFDYGLTLAGVPPGRKRNILLTREGAGAAVTIASTAAGTVSGQMKDTDVHQAVDQAAAAVTHPAAPDTALAAQQAVQQAQEAVSATLGLWQWAAIVFAVLGLLGAGLVIYGMWHRRRRGMV